MTKKKASQKTDSATEDGSSIPTFVPLEGDVGKDHLDRERFYRIDLKDENGEEQAVYTNVPPGFTNEQAVEQAVEFARQKRRVEQYWTKSDEIDEVALQQGEGMLRAAASIVVQNLLRIGTDVHGDAFDEHLGEHWNLDDAVEAITKPLLEDPEAVEELALDVQKQVLAAILQEDIDESVLDEEEFDEALRAALYKRGPEHWKDFAYLVAQDIAGQVLSNMDAVNRPLDELVALLKPTTRVEVVDGVETIRSFPASGISHPADVAANRLVQYAGGRIPPLTRDKDGWDLLIDPMTNRFRGRTYDITDLAVRPGRSRFVEDLANRKRTETELVDPESVEPVVDLIFREGNVMKAKTLLAALIYAAEASDPTRFGVDFDHYVNFVTGLHRTGPKKTRSDVYWRKAAELWRYLQYDLQHLQVNVRIVRQEGDAATTHEVLGEYLMEKPRLRAKQDFLYSRIHDEMTEAALSGDDKRLIDYMKTVGVTAIEIGFPRSVAAAFGIGKRKREIANPDGMSLKGAAFWFWCDIPLRRRWDQSGKKPKGEGASLLEMLERYSFIEESKTRTGGRPSYKTAISRFLDAVDQMVEIGELDAPGVRIWRHHGGPGRPKDDLEELRARSTKPGAYLTPKELEIYSVELVHLKERREELQHWRAKKRKPARKKRSSTA